MDELKNLFETERKLLSISGFYPRRHGKHRRFFFFSAFVNTVISYLQLFSMVGQMVVDRKDLSKLTDTLLFFMTHFTFLGKLTNFGYYRRSLLDLEDDLSDTVFQRTTILGVKVDACNTVAKIFRYLCIVCILFYSVLPCMEKGKKLPLPGWLPYDTTEYYYETVTFQILSICISAYNNSSIDILTWKLITIASAELEILKEKLQGLNYESRSQKAFKSCIKLHTAIFRLVQRIEFIFSKGIFMQFFSSVVIICFTGFQLIVVPIPSTQFIFLIMYFFCMMCQVGMYCWYGHEVMTTSDELGKCCYMSNWYDSDMRIRKSIEIFMERTKKPIKLTAGIFVTLSLQTLSGILRSSYSYFAVLQRLYDEDISY